MSGLAISRRPLPSGRTIAVLAFDRADAANALNPALASALGDALAKALADPEVAAVVLTGSGERVFCAGADLKNPDDLAPDALRKQRANVLHDVLRDVLAFEKPLVVAANGAAIGAGAMIAILADRLIMSPRATLSLPEVRLGIASILGLTILRDLFGGAAATDLILSGRKLGADEAVQRGIAGKACDAPLEAAIEAAGQLVCEPDDAYRLNKRWLNGQRWRSCQSAISESLAN